MKISKRGSWNISKNSRNLWNFQTWKFHPTSLITEQELMGFLHSLFMRGSTALCCMKGCHLEILTSSKIQSCQSNSMRIYVKNISAKFLPNPIWNDAALSFFVKTRYLCRMCLCLMSNKKKMSSNRSVSDLAVQTSRFQQNIRFINYTEHKLKDTKNYAVTSNSWADIIDSVVDGLTHNKNSQCVQTEHHHRYQPPVNLPTVCKNKRN